MKQEVAKKKSGYPIELTEMQRRFCEYLVMNEGRTTGKDAAIAAGYSPKNASQEAYGLQQNPQIQMYLTKRMNEVNKSFIVNRHNYLKRQINLSKMVEDGHPHAAKAAPFESHIAKAMGIFIDRKEIYTRDLTAEDKIERKEELLAKMRKMKRVNKLIEKQTTSQKSQDELEPITSPMSDE
jgi:phage terminase small subunit|tara:strand:- start:679 stop:1221 length:543 start_codon:yes stop_codon:yes gene_type:complete